MGLAYGIQHFNKMKWLGDNEMQKFKMNWNDIVHLQGTPLDDTHLAEILLQLLQESKVMAPDIAIYRSKVYRTGVNDYAELTSILDRHISMYCEKVNNQRLSDAFEKNSRGGAAKPAAPAGPASGKGNTVCRYHLSDGGCRRGDSCPFQHPSPTPAAAAGAGGGKDGKGKKGKGNGKGEGKGKGSGGKGSRSPSPSSDRGSDAARARDKEKVCVHFAT